MKQLLTQKFWMEKFKMKNNNNLKIILFMSMLCILIASCKHETIKDNPVSAPNVSVEKVYKHPIPPNADLGKISLVGADLANFVTAVQKNLDKGGDNMSYYTGYVASFSPRTKTEKIKGSCC